MLSWIHAIASSCALQKKEQVFFFMAIRNLTGWYSFLPSSSVNISEGMKSGGCFLAELEVKWEVWLGNTMEKTVLLQGRVIQMGSTWIFQPFLYQRQWGLKWLLFRVRDMLGLADVFSSGSVSWFGCPNVSQWEVLIADDTGQNLSCLKGSKMW